jgi:hypothetical protein
MSYRFLTFLALIFSVSLIAAEARRGFSSSGTGQGSYDGAASVNSWDLSLTPDADCLLVHGDSCANLTPAQIEEVAGFTAQAQGANYANHNDYTAANVYGYLLTPEDGTQWTDARNPGADNSGTDASWNTDCDNTYASSGGCDAITNGQFSDIDDPNTGRTAAIAAGFDSYTDLQTASALDYEMTSSDAALWDEANNGSVSAAACDAEFPGRTCNQLTKASFENAKNANALIAAKIAKVNAGTLTSADLLTDLGLVLSSSSLSAPISAWQLDYLETVLGTSNNTTTADWQATLNNYDNAAASAWYIWKIASSTAASGAYAASNATAALFNAAGASSAVTALGVSNTQMASDIRASGFSSAPTVTQLNDFLTEARGFADGTSYASVSTALGNNWSIGNYLTASSNGGWTSSSADGTSFNACLASSDDATGGGATCSVSKSGWQSIQAIANIAGGSGNLTAADVTNVLLATGTTENAALDTSNSKHIDYLQSCASGSDAAQAVADCAASGSFLVNATSFEIGKAVADNSGAYAVASVVTTAKLTAVGIPSNSIKVISGNYCGNNGTSSCLTALRNSLASSGLTAASTPAQVTAKVNELMRAGMVTVSNGASIPAGSPGAGCSASVNLDVPAMCGHPQWTCTMTSSPAGWSFSNNQIVVPANATAANNQSATIRMTLNIYTPSYTKDVTRSYDIRTAVAGAVNGLKRFSDSAWNAEDPRRGQNSCRNKGGRLATDAEFGQTGGSVSHRNFHWTTADTTINFNTNSSAGNKRTQGKTCNFGGGTNYSRYKNGFYKCWGTSTSSTIHYACGDLPSCN